MGKETKQLLGNVEYTHRWYRRYLRELLQQGYDFRAFSERIGDGDVILRHDVDLSVTAAAEMARIEADLNVSSTYFVLCTSALYNPLEKKYRTILQEIESLGHEVALHFSTHEYWPAGEPPDADEIERQVAEERSVLGSIVEPTETVSFHRPLSWVLDRDFDGFRNTYAPAYFSDIDYVADSSQRWRDDPPPVDGFPETRQILTHPGLWAEGDRGFEYCLEQAISNTCGHASRNARNEFTDGGTI